MACFRVVPGGPVLNAGLRGVQVAVVLVGRV